MVDAARTIRRHCDGVLRWLTSHLTNGLLGYRTGRNLIAMVYLIAGRLELNVTHLY